MKSPIEVLVLDDEAIVGERLKDHLEKKDYLVETFTESKKALDRLAEKEFDVVITDLKMEAPGGLEVLRHVRDHTEGTQVIMITGFGSMEAVREAEFSGVFEFVHKPFSAKDLEAATKKAATKARRLRRRGGG
jgi:DNA-binding NtrC family response regulator